MNLKRRSNGKGTVVYLGKGRYKPYSARILLGWDINGKPIVYDIETFETELDALVFLENYHKDPKPLKIKQSKYDRIVIFTNTTYPLVPVETLSSTIVRKDKKNYTFKQVFEDMKKLKFPTKEEMKLERERHIRADGKFGLHNALNMTTAYNNSKGLHDFIYRDLRTSDFQTFINNSNKGSSPIQNMVKLYKNMDKFALQEDIIDKSYAEYLVKPKSQTKERTPFTYEQIEALWNIKPENNAENFICDIFLIALYSGCRAEEILSICNKNVFLKEDYFITGIKTDNGRNRQIPIHHKIKGIIEKYYNPKNEFLFTKNNNIRFDYGDFSEMYRKYFRDKYTFLEKKSLHFARHTVETEFQKLNVKPIIINSILGHKNGSTGADIYTHISLEEKKNAIELITYQTPKILILDDKKDKKILEKIQ